MRLTNNEPLKKAIEITRNHINKSTLVGFLSARAPSGSILNRNTESDKVIPRNAIGSEEANKATTNSLNKKIAVITLATSSGIGIFLATRYGLNVLDQVTGFQGKVLYEELGIFNKPGAFIYNALYSGVLGQWGLPLVSGGLVFKKLIGARHQSKVYDPDTKGYHIAGDMPSNPSGSQNTP